MKTSHITTNSNVLFSLTEMGQNTANPTIVISTKTCPCNTVICSTENIKLYIKHHKDCLCSNSLRFYGYKKVQVGKDQEKAQSEKDSHSKNRGGKEPK